MSSSKAPPGPVATQKKEKKAAVKKAALLTQKVCAAPAAKQDEAGDEELTMEQEEELGKKYMETRRATAVSVFRRFIADMKAVGATEAVLTNHPSYDLNCGVCAMNNPEGTEKPKLGAIGNGTGNCALWETRPFFRSVWEQAGGVGSGVRVILFENGIGDMMDLSTGEEPPEGSMQLPGYA